MNNDNQQNSLIKNETPNSSNDAHPIATGLGAAVGGIAGVALGKSVSGKVGAAVGGLAGALAGGIAGNTVADVTSLALKQVQPKLALSLGADTKPIELLPHYSWEELKALSKPQAVPN